MGYAAGCLYPWLREALSGRGRGGTAMCEVVCAIIAAWAIVLGNAILPRSVFTLLFAIFVLLLSLEGGPVSKLLGAAPLVKLGRFELAFYVFHQPCISLAWYLIGGRGRKALLAFVFTCLLVFLWGGAFKKGCAGRAH